MMMLRNSSGKIAKWVVGLLLVMVGTRLLIFVLAALGLIRWAGSSASGVFWVLPVLMILMMALMFFLMRPRMMRHAQGSGSTETPSEILQKRFPWPGPGDGVFTVVSPRRPCSVEAVSGRS
jgi:uncharacterized membrane protein